MDEILRLERKVKLHNTVMIIGLDGWGNAGRVSTFTVRYLTDKLGARKLGEIPPEMFHNYQIERPMVSIRRGVIESYNPPRNEIFYWKDKRGRVDLLLLLGSEPHLNWPCYAKAILKLAKEMDVKRIYTIGGYLADVHHGDETPITASTNNEELIGELKEARVELTNYRGPTSVYSEILWQAKAENLDVVSLWCAVPIYVGGFYPKAAYHMLRKIKMMVGLDINLGDIRKKAESFEAQFERRAAEQPELHRLIEKMRGSRGLEKGPTYMV